MNHHVRHAAIAVLALCASLLMAPAVAAPSTSTVAAVAPEGSISGRVTGSPGAPVSSQVSVEPERRNAHGHWVQVGRTVRVKADGSYVLRVSTPGTYRVRAYDLGVSSSDFRVVPVSKGAERTGVTLSLAPHRAISGTVTTEGFLLSGLDPDLPVLVEAVVPGQRTWTLESEMSTRVAADGAYVLSVPRPYSGARLRFSQWRCPDDPAVDCEFGTPSDVLSAFWNGSTHGAPTLEQATPVDVSGGSAAGKDVTLTLAKKFASATRPRIAGSARLGATLTAHPGAYSPAADFVVYEWYAGSAGEPGEYDTLVGTGRTFVVTPDEVGGSLVVHARPVLAGYEGPISKSAYVSTRSRSSLAVKAKAGKRKATVTVRVKAPGLSTARIYGKASIYAKGKRIKTVTVRNGKATIKIAKQRKGKRTYTVRWSGNLSITSATKSLKIRIH